MKPRELQQTCGWCIAQSFSKKLLHLKITQVYDRLSLVELLVSFARHYHVILTHWGIEDQLYRSLIACIRNRQNHAVFLTAMLVYCSKVTIDQIGMAVNECSQTHEVESGLCLSQDECWGMLQVLTEYQKQQSQYMNQGKEEGTKSFMLPTKCLVLEGIYFHDSNFVSHLLEKMPNLQRLSLEGIGTQGAMKALCKHCKLLESLCFLESVVTQFSSFENDIYLDFFDIPSSTKLQDAGSLLSKFASDQEFRKNVVFQFPNLRRLDIDELTIDDDTKEDIYTLTLLLQPKLMCCGKHTGITKKIITNYKKIWSTMNKRAENEATLQLSEAKFLDYVLAVPRELSYWQEQAPIFENLVSIELQKSLWSETEVAQFCWLFSKQIRTFSLGELPLSDMSCLSNMTHLRLTLSGQHSFDKLHLILDSCPNLHTLSIHPTLYHEEARRHYEREEFVVDQIVEENLDLFERLMFADVMREVVNVQPMMQNPEEGSRFWRMSKKEPAKPHNLTTLRIASLCEAGQKQSEIFLRGVFERLPNLRNLCLGMWMGSLSQMRQFLTCTATALVSVVTDKELKEPLLPHLRQLCCLPTGDKTQMCQSLASLVEALPSLHTLVLPALDDGALAPTLRHFQHSSIDIQYKCATDHVFSYWEPVH